MSRKYKFWDDNELYFVTFTVVKWVDVFIREEYREIIVDSIKYCQQNKGLEVYAWVIMTNHMHMIISSSKDSLPALVRDFKSFTSRSIREAIKTNLSESRREWIMRMFTEQGIKNSNNNGFQFWQQHSHPIELNSSYLMDQKLDYIHLNPVKAGFVDEPANWLYSSARDYEGVKGLIDVKYIE